jgi:threonine/homoserine/homoserine lactone efflux protein
MQLQRTGTVLVILLVWYAAWGLADTYTEQLSRAERQRLYISILLGVVLVISFFPHMLDRF